MRNSFEDKVNSLKEGLKFVFPLLFPSKLNKTTIE